MDPWTLVSGLTAIIELQSKIIVKRCIYSNTLITTQHVQTLQTFVLVEKQSWNYQLLYKLFIGNRSVGFGTKILNKFCLPISRESGYACFPDNDHCWAPYLSFCHYIYLPQSLLPTVRNILRDSQFQSARLGSKGLWVRLVLLESLILHSCLGYCMLKSADTISDISSKVCKFWIR